MLSLINYISIFGQTLPLKGFFKRQTATPLTVELILQTPSESENNSTIPELSLLFMAFIFWLFIEDIEFVFV